MVWLGLMRFRRLAIKGMVGLALCGKNGATLVP